MSEAETLVNDAYEALAAADAAALAALCAPDITVHIPGRGPQAGTYRGEEGLGELLGKLAELTDGTFRVELSEIIPGDPHLVALAFLVGERAGRKLDAREVHVWEVRAGKLTAWWSHPADQYAVDAFFGPAGQPSGAAAAAGGAAVEADVVTIAASESEGEPEAEVEADVLMFPGSKGPGESSGTSTGKDD